MIITKQKNIEDILKMLEGRQKIFLVGCGDCAATCKTGGEPELAAMAEILKSRGKEITGCIVPEVACVSAQAKIAFVKNRQALQQSSCILVFACGSGVQCMRDNALYNLDVYPACDSLFAAMIDKDNSFKEVCRACGDCLLSFTEGVCPQTRCAKGLLNGPCGGQDHGKCEVYPERDCAWILIYKRLKEKNKLEQLKKHQPAKDYRKPVDRAGYL